MTLSTQPDLMPKTKTTMRQSISILIFIIGCSTKDKVDNALTADSRDTISYEPLFEPPPLRVERIRTDSSEIKTRYDEELNFIREFNQLDSFEVTYFKDFSFKTKKISEEGVFVEGDQKGIWSYYDSTGKLTSTKDFGRWNKKMHVRNTSYKPLQGLE